MLLYKRWFRGWSLETDKTLTLSNSKNSLIISNKLVVFVNNLGDVTAADIQSV